MHQTVGALNAKNGSSAPKFLAHSNPLPLSLRESVELDSVLLVLAALFVLVPFCLLSGETPALLQHRVRPACTISQGQRLCARPNTLLAAGTPILTQEFAAE